MTAQEKHSLVRGDQHFGEILCRNKGYSIVKYLYFHSNLPLED